MLAKTMKAQSFKKFKKKKKSYRNPKVHTETRVKEMKDFDGMKF